MYNNPKETDPNWYFSRSKIVAKVNVQKVFVNHGYRSSGCSAVGMHFFFSPSLSLSGSIGVRSGPGRLELPRPDGAGDWNFVEMKWLFFGRKTKLEWRDSCPEMEDLFQSYLCHAWGPKLGIGISFATKRMKWTIIPQRSMSRFLSTYHFSIHFPILSKNYVPQPLLLKNPRKLSLTFWCFLLACQVQRVPSSNPWHDPHTWLLVWKLWSQAISDSF